MYSEEVDRSWNLQLPFQNITHPAEYKYTEKYKTDLLNADMNVSMSGGYLWLCMLTVYLMFISFVLFYDKIIAGINGVLML